MALLLSTTPGATEDPSFNRDIRPILSENCFQCHGPDARARKAGLRLDTEEGALALRDGVRAVVPGRPEESELVHRIMAEDPRDRMPPPESERELDPEERGMLRDWIAAGAVYQRHWAFETVRRPPLPEVASEAGGGIDRFLLEQLERRGWGFAPEADRETLLRRLRFDLTGLPPDPEEIDAFLADTGPDVFERWVDRLLADPGYGERMAAEWLDVARYSDTYGYQVDRDRFVWPWRDWVVDSFNANLPYDEFIVNQLAGDLLPGADENRILATTFSRLHPQKVEGGSVPEEFRVEYVADRTQTVGTAFLGLTLECARCHDHKYDPVSQKEYYQLTSFFANIDEAGLYSYFTSSVPTPTLALGDAEKKAEREELLEQLRRGRAAMEERIAATRPAFDAWLAEREGLSEEVEGAVASFDFESMEEGRIPNLVDPEKPATSPAANRLVDVPGGRAILLTGDDEVDLKVGNFTRDRPWSIALRLKVAGHEDRAVVFHRSRAWTDAGSRGYQMLLEEGRPSFSLIHFWPGNAIRVRALEPIPPDRMVHLAVVYDGSLRAEGIRLFVDGREVETGTVRDRLRKNITGGGHDAIAIGARFRDKGLRGGVVDDFVVHDRELSALEVRHLHDGESLRRLRGKPSGDLTGEEREALFEFHVLRVDPAIRSAREELAELRRRIRVIEDGFREIMVMRERSTPRISHILHRGHYDARREAVENRTPSILPPMNPDLPRDRLGLARWLVDRDHPLTARVTVNRYWQMFFGRGLVATPEDFGSQGAPPTHPELLDWLAADFMENGWDLKRLVRQMVRSRAYRQASVAPDGLRESDPRNLWLGRAPRHRWPAEMIRDGVLAAGGLLVPRMGGPPVRPYEVAVSFKPAKPDGGAGLYRRSLYTYWKRTAPAPVMRVLDAAKREVCSVRREVTSTPLQAFVFLNDPQFVEAARFLAHRVLSRHRDRRALEVLYRSLTGHRPDGEEMRILASMLEDQRAYFERHPDRADAFLSVGEGTIEGFGKTPEWAALTAVASGLMAHERHLMRQ